MRRWFIVLVGVATGVSIFITMDRVKSHDPMQDDGSVVAMPPGGPAPKDARVFVFIIDSLRYETAMDPTIMPNLAHLRSIGTYAKASNIANAVTVPSLHTIFTGLEDNSLLGFVKNFVADNSFTVESLFEQLRHAGINSTVCAELQFIDFRFWITSYHIRNMRFLKERTEQEILEAADALKRGECGLAVGHYPYTDYAAHRYGAEGGWYRAEFHRADALIQRIQERLPPGATFVVLGDHGHTADGNHSLGYGVPTVAVYTGPLFHRGLDLGTMKLASNRYLLNAAFSLPLRTFGFTGEYRPEALTTSSAAATRDFHHARTNHRINWRDTLIWLGFGALAALWLNLALMEWSPFSFRGWRWMLVVAPLTACVLPLEIVAPATLGLATIAFLLAERRSDSIGQRIVWSLGMVVAAWALHGWGSLLSVSLEFQRAVTIHRLMAGWAVVAGLGLAFATRRNRAVLAWICLGVPGMLLLPTNSHYGWTSVATPALLCWYAFYLKTTFVETRRANDSEARPHLGVLIGQALLVFLFLQAQFASDALYLVFSGWKSLIPGSADSVGYLTALGSIACFVLFCTEPKRASSRIMAMILTLLIYPVQWRLWPTSPGPWLALLAVAATVWWIAHRRRSEHATAIGVWVGLAVSVYFIRPPLPNQAMFCCALAAIALAVRLLRRHPQLEHALADRIFLLAAGVVSVGHAMCRWSITDLEWRAAYDWIEPPQVQHFAAFVLVWIIAKGWVPWRVMRQANAESPARGPHFRAVMAVKCASVILIMTGLGVTATPVLGAYIEAAQQAAILGIMTLYVLL